MKGMTQMKRSMLMLGTSLATLALLATGAVAQGWGGGPGCRWMTFKPEDAQKAAGLQQKLCQAQQSLRLLQIQQAGQEQIDKRAAEVARLRGDLAKLATTAPGGVSLQPGAGAGLAATGLGLGRGPCGLGLGLGRGGGRGMGYGRRAGACWRR